MVSLGISDLFDGKKIYSNVKLRKIPSGFSKNITYLTKDKIKNIFELIKTGKFPMKNSTVMLQEAHNYLDSRNSQSQQNKTLTYWILQSRHTGEGSCDIIYDTQEIGQVDKRLRRNTDYFFKPYITERIDGVPSKILLIGQCKLGHKWVTFQQELNVSNAIKHYDTHEIVDF